MDTISFACCEDKLRACKLGTEKVNEQWGDSGSWHFWSLSPDEGTQSQGWEGCFPASACADSTLEFSCSQKANTLCWRHQPINQEEFQSLLLPQPQMSSWSRTFLVLFPLQIQRPATSKVFGLQHAFTKHLRNQELVNIFSELSGRKNDLWALPNPSKPG